MSNVAVPPEEADQQDVTSYALEGWGRTVRLCVIRLTEAIPPALGPVVIWLCLRH